MNANAPTLTESVRIPLHELQADVDYLIGRVVADGSCAPMVAASIKTKLANVEAALPLVGVERAALPPLRAREEIARLHEILKELAEPLNYRQFTKWNPQALASEALTILSRTAGQGWREPADNQTTDELWKDSVGL